MYHTKALYEVLSDDVDLNISINENGYLSLYIYLPEDVLHPYFGVNLVVDSDNDNEHDFDVVKRTLNERSVNYYSTILHTNRSCNSNTKCTWKMAIF